jgi:Dual specificity phosphatase, catalytic domain
VDFDFILDRRLAVGGGIWTREAMAELVRFGFTHVLDLQAEFDDSALAAELGVIALWLPTEDDSAAKPLDFFERAADFALRALDRPEAQVYVHCAAGIHRGPLAAAAILHALGFEVQAAMELVVARRAAAEFPSVYADSLREWAAARAGGNGAGDPVREDGCQIPVDRSNPGSV